mgnify:CR=1 FL=1
MIFARLVTEGFKENLSRTFLPVRLDKWQIVSQPLNIITQEN